MSLTLKQKFKEASVLVEVKENTARGLRVLMTHVALPVFHGR